jgi:hypothetical protein
MNDNSAVKTIYLSRDEIATGPFDPEQIAEMKRSGEFYRYEHHWDNTMTEWSKIPPAPSPPPPVPNASAQLPLPPPPPPASSSSGIQEKNSATPAASIPSRPAATSKPAVAAPAKQAVEAPVAHPVDYPAICHDYKRTQGGLATQITSQGCTFVCAPQETPPGFGKGARVWIDLFDEKTDRSLTTKAVVSTLEFDEKNWKIQLLWEVPPKF